MRRRYPAQYSDCAVAAVEPIDDLAYFLAVSPCSVIFGIESKRRALHKCESNIATIQKAGLDPRRIQSFLANGFCNCDYGCDGTCRKRLKSYETTG